MDLSVDTQYLRIGAPRRSGSEGRGGLEPYPTVPLLKLVRFQLGRSLVGAGWGAVTAHHWLS